MKPAREAIASIVSDALRRTLAAAGFSHEPSFGFRRGGSDVVDVVRVQLDDAYGATGRFSLCAGVCHAKVRKLLSLPMVERPVDDECTVTARFGPAGAGTGAWIVGDAKQPPAVTKAQLVDVWRAAVVPWFAVVGDLRALHAALEAGAVVVGARLVAVAIALGVDDKEAAQRRLDRAFQQTYAELDADDEPDRATKRLLVDAARLAAVHRLREPPRPPRGG